MFKITHEEAAQITSLVDQLNKLEGIAVKGEDGWDRNFDAVLCEVTMTFFCPTDGYYSQIFSCPTAQDLIEELTEDLSDLKKAA